MRKPTIIALLIMGLMGLWLVTAVAQEAEKANEHEYVGSNKCKICHKDVYEAWEQTGHATTFADLTEEEQKKEECYVCHITGTDADGEMLTDVGCEACHGPGSDYKSPKVKSKKKWAENPEEMRKLAQEAGLISVPSAEDCTQCHKKEGNPNFKPFDYEEMKDKVHPIKAEEG